MKDCGFSVKICLASNRFSSSHNLIPTSLTRENSPFLAKLTQSPLNPLTPINMFLNSALERLNVTKPPQSFSNHIFILILRHENSFSQQILLFAFAYTLNYFHPFERLAFTRRSSSHCLISSRAKKKT